MKKEILIPRLKSFAWRLGGMVLAFTLTFIGENIGLFGLSPMWTTILGLFIGEVTKALNTQK